MGDRRENDSAERISELGRAFAVALLTGDEVEAESVIREAMDEGIGAAEIDDAIIARALWLVGDLWQRNEITVADEHLATEIAIRVLALQREAQRVARSRGTQRVLLAAPAGELHIVALRMVDGVLRDAGFDVFMLGADVPAQALAASAVRYRPSVICLSATMAGAGDQLLLAIHETELQWPSASFVVGGRAVTSRLRATPRVSVCEQIAEAVDAVDAMAKRAAMN